MQQGCRLENLFEFSGSQGFSRCAGAGTTKSRPIWVPSEMQAIFLGGPAHELGCDCAAYDSIEDSRMA